MLPDKSATGLHRIIFCQGQLKLLEGHKLPFQLPGGNDQDLQARDRPSRPVREANREHEKKPLVASIAKRKLRFFNTNGCQRC